MARPLSVSALSSIELLGLFLGLAAVLLLIKEHIATWPVGIGYILVSLVIFWEARLFGDLLLHLVFFILHIYGWWYWRTGQSSDDAERPVTRLSPAEWGGLFVATPGAIYLFGRLLLALPEWVESLPVPSLPYWDAATSVLSVFAMIATARKRIENWLLWFVVDVLASAIYAYKGLYFYAVLYLVYLGLAVAGYQSWRRHLDADAPELVPAT